MNQLTPEERDQFIKEYPQFAWAINHPEIGPLLWMSIHGDPADPTDGGGWSKEKLEGRLQQTKWWKDTTPTIRAYDTRYAQDPKAVEREIQIQADAIIERAKQVGYAIPGAVAWDLAIKTLRFGWTESEVERAVRSSFILQPEALQGEALQVRQAVRDTAEKALVILDQDDLDRWTTDIARGMASVDQFSEWLREHEDRLSAGATEAQRRWDIESTRNPADTTRQVQSTAAAIKDYARQVGFVMSDYRAQKLANESLRNEWDQVELQRQVKALFGKPEPRVELVTGGQYGSRGVLIDTSTGRVAFLGPNNEPGYDPRDLNKPAGGQYYRMADGREVYYVPGTAPKEGAAGPQELTGEAVGLREKLRLLTGDYLIRMTDADLSTWIANIIRGDKTEDDFRVWLTGYAKTLFPSLAPSLDAGLTVRQAASPYAGIIERELGTPAEQIDWMDPKWQRFLSTPADGGGTRAMDLWEVSQMIRTDPTYGWHKTPNANAQAAEMAQFITDTFTGVR